MSYFVWIIRTLLVSYQILIFGIQLDRIKGKMNTSYTNADKICIYLKGKRASSVTGKYYSKIFIIIISLTFAIQIISKKLKLDMS